MQAVFDVLSINVAMQGSDEDPHGKGGRPARGRTGGGISGI